MLGSLPAIMETVTVRVRWDHVGEVQSGHLGRAQSTKAGATQLWSITGSSQRKQQTNSDKTSDSGEVEVCCYFRVMQMPLLDKICGLRCGLSFSELQVHALSFSCFF